MKNHFKFKRCFLMVFVCLFLGVCTSAHFMPATVQAKERLPKFKKQEVSIVKGDEHTLCIKHKNTSDSVIYSVKDSNIVSIVNEDNNRCTIRANAVGTTTVYAVIVQDGKQLRTSNCTITVTPAAASVRFRLSSLTLQEGETVRIRRILSLKPKTTAEKPKYEIADPAIAEIDKYGNITGIKEGRTTVTATIRSGRSDSITVTVIKASDTNTNTIYNIHREKSTYEPYETSE